MFTWNGTCSVNWIARIVQQHGKESGTFTFSSLIFVALAIQGKLKIGCVSDDFGLILEYTGHLKLLETFSPCGSQVLC